MMIFGAQIGMQSCALGYDVFSLYGLIVNAYI
jgi:hypothetical protein